MNTALCFIAIYLYLSLVPGFTMYALGGGRSPFWRWWLFWPLSFVLLAVPEEGRVFNFVRCLILGKS